MQILDWVERTNTLAYSPGASMMKKKLFYKTDTPHQQFQHLNKKS